MKATYSILRCDSDVQPKLRAAAAELTADLSNDSRVAKVWASGGLQFRVETDAANPTPLDHVAIAVWSSDEEALTAARRRVDETLGTSDERWDVVVEPVRVQGSLDGFVPEVATPLAEDEPVLIQIQGNLTAEGALPFLEAIPSTIAQAFGNPGYLGGSGSPTPTSRPRRSHAGAPTATRATTPLARATTTPPAEPTAPPSGTTPPPSSSCASVRLCRRGRFRAGTRSPASFLSADTGPLIVLGAITDAYRP